MARGWTEPKAAPTTELGRPGLVSGVGGLVPWSFFVDDREFAADVTWPRSVQTYQKMQTDAQLKGLLLATTLPIRRMRWEIDPNGAKPEVVAHIASSLNLPIAGQDPDPIRRRRRFNHDTHMAHALRALAYGHYYFEQVYEYRDPKDGGDGLLHLRKLGTRPPRTIAQIMPDEFGGLKAIKQNIAVVGNQGGLDAAGLTGRELGVERLVAYIWDSEDDGDWVGRSLLRACHKNHVIKNRLIRVDAVKHERNAMGIPWFKVDPHASDGQIKELAKVAERVRAGEQSGGAGPGDLSIKGVEGNLPDTIGSIRYHDQQMSRAFLLLFYDLGTTQTGSRALGGDFIDWYADAQDAIADWYAQTTQLYQVEDEVELNWGPDEQPPLLTYQRMEALEMSLHDLETAVTSGLIAVDDEVREYVVRRWHLPKGAAQPPAALPATEATPPPAAPSQTTTERESTKPAGRAELAERIAATVDRPMRWVEVAAALGIGPKDGTARRARETLVSAGRLSKRSTDAGIVLAPAAGINLPDRELHRAPMDFEVAAAVDFAEMETVYLRERTSLIDAYKTAQVAQIAGLASAVAAANGDAAALANLSAEPVSVEMIHTHLMQAATEGEAAAKAEREAQLGPAAATVPSAAAADQSRIEERVRQEAEGVALTLAAGLAVAASKHAAVLRGLPPSEMASGVSEYLSGLSDAALNEQLGGAVHHSYGVGRQEVIRASEPKSVAASELLDERTCLAPEARVRTEQGLKRADCVTLEDRLLTHAGRFVHPDAILTSDVEEELVALEIGGRTLRLTADHPVLVRGGDDFAWREAGKLTVGDLIVGEASLEHGREVLVNDLALCDPPDRVAPRGKARRLASISRRPFGVPVITVGLDDEVVDQKIDNPRADLGLDSEAKRPALQEHADSLLDARLGVGGNVTAARAIAPSTLFAGDHPEALAAVRAVDQNRRPAAGLAAEASGPGVGVAKGGSASSTDRDCASIFKRAFPRAVVVTRGVRDRDCEGLATATADLLNAIQRAAWAVGNRVLNSTCVRAVDGANPVGASKFASAALAIARRLSFSIPALLRRAALATSADTADWPSATHTRPVHQDIVLQRVDSIVAMPYRGLVFDFTIPFDATFWAEGILVHNCGECEAIDGEEYESLAASEADYPMGAGYAACQGGLLCRGCCIASY